jgi:luciferase-like monooxygenase
MSIDRLDFGIFLAPFHPVRENPTLSLRRDFELIERLDELGYDEAWIGEHHSGGYEIIASPEIFIAAAAERTEHIRLGRAWFPFPIITLSWWPTASCSSITRRGDGRCSASAPVRCPPTRS